MLNHHLYYHPLGLINDRGYIMALNDRRHHHGFVYDDDDAGMAKKSVLSIGTSFCSFTIDGGVEKEEV